MVMVLATVVVVMVVMLVMGLMLNQSCYVNLCWLRDFFGGGDFRLHAVRPRGLLVEQPQNQVVHSQ